MDLVIYLVILLAVVIAVLSAVFCYHMSLRRKTIATYLACNRYKYQEGTNNRIGSMFIISGVTPDVTTPATATSTSTTSQKVPFNDGEQQGCPVYVVTNMPPPYGEEPPPYSYSNIANIHV